MEWEVPRFTVADVYDGLQSGKILENHPEAVRGPCCLLSGKNLERASGSHYLYRDAYTAFHYHGLFDYLE